MPRADGNSPPVEKKGAAPCAIPVEEDLSDAQLWDADYSSEVFEQAAVVDEEEGKTTIAAASNEEKSPPSAPVKDVHSAAEIPKVDKVDQNYAGDDNIDYARQVVASQRTFESQKNVIERNDDDVPLDCEKNYDLKFEHTNTGSKDDETKETFVDTATTMHTPLSQKSSAASQVLLSRSARRLSYLAERYSIVGNFKSSPSQEPVSSGIDSSPGGASATIRSGGAKPLLPQLNRRSSRKDPRRNDTLESSVLSPLHPQDASTVKKEGIEPTACTPEEVQSKRSSLPPMTPPRSYVHTFSLKENGAKLNEQPGGRSMLQSMRSVSDHIYLFNNSFIDSSNNSRMILSLDVDGRFQFIDSRVLEECTRCSYTPSKFCRTT